MRKLFRQRLLAVLASLGITIPSSLFAPRAAAQARDDEALVDKFEQWCSERVGFPAALVDLRTDPLCVAFERWCASRDFVVSESPRG